MRHCKGLRLTCSPGLLLPLHLLFLRDQRLLQSLELRHVLDFAPFVPVLEVFEVEILALDFVLQLLDLLFVSTLH